jgi:hypothetical protein
MMRKYITQVALDQRVIIMSDIHQIPNSRFFTWTINKNFGIGRMAGTVHCEVFAGFKSCKMLNVGINYAGDDHLQIFPNEELVKLEEDRLFNFSDKEFTVKHVSKLLSEDRRQHHFKLVQDNKYRGVVWQTLINQPISNFMDANCNVPFSVLYPDLQ